MHEPADNFLRTRLLGFSFQIWKGSLFVYYSYAMNTPIVDSALTPEEIIKQNPMFHCPTEVLKRIVVVEVKYYSFDGRIHSGQVAVHQDLADDVKGAFKLLLNDKFPIQSAIPIADVKFGWDDGVSTSANNTSAFNYRHVRDTKVMSNHATGRAIDINPRLNPYFPGEKVFPLQASYDPGVEGTILASSKLVKYFEDLGWCWGGKWDEDLDFQHFEKPQI